MKADVKAQWVKDLRSGEFEQGTGYLRRDNGEGGKDRYCCLGVLCEQAVKAGVIPAPELHAGHYSYLDNDDDRGRESFNQPTSLPRKVSEWAGLMDANGEATGDVIIRPQTAALGRLTAIGANDAIGGKELTFAEIADLIALNVPVE